MKTFIQSFILLFLTNVIQAQEIDSKNKETVSTNQMIANYKSNCEKKEMNAIRQYDFIVGFQETNLTILSFSPLKELPDIPLKNIRAEWAIKQNEEQPQLYLKKIHPIDLPKEKSLEIYTRLEKEYGKDIKFGIPAKWFTGEIVLLVCPKNSFGEIVSKEGYLFAVREGGIVSQTEINAKTGKWETPFREHEDGSVDVKGDGCWWGNMQMHADKLNDLANKRMQESGKAVAGKEYVILLNIDAVSGTTASRLLSPQTMDTKEEKAAVNQLMKQLKEIPAWSYGPLITINQKWMYGRYLRAVWSGKEWMLKECLLE